jgi:hypothetical protein
VQKGGVVRVLVKTLVVLAVLWSLYWGAAGWLMQRGVTQWFSAQSARGWQAEFADLSLGGYPARHVTRIAAPALADPATGVAWQADAVEIDARALWPGHVTMRFDDTPQRFSYFDQTVTLQAADMRADLRLLPGLALELETLSLSAGRWRLVGETGPLAEAQTLSLSANQQDSPETYAIRLTADALTPGVRLRELARITDTLPPAFDTFEMSATVTWDKPWDRSALEQARPQPRHVRLRLAEAKWGALRLFAAGEFTVDAAGVPEGVITIKAEQWREMLAIAEDSGTLPSDAARAAERTLGFLENLGGNPNALDLRLNLRGGAVALGPIPLGPAPRFVLR